MTVPVVVRELGRTRYAPVFQAMKAFTEGRSEETADELWLTEHEPVFTQGQAGKPEHVLAPGEIPVVQSDRGGQVTYHGPGQVVAYLMFDIRRRGLSVRELVRGIERAVVDTLFTYGVAGEARPDAPGVYVQGAKIAALGLRVRRGCAYHGLALNVGVDLAPFACINPCGLRGMQVTRLADLAPLAPYQEVSGRLLTALAAAFELRLTHTSGNRGPGRAAACAIPYGAHRGTARSR